MAEPSCITSDGIIEYLKSKGGRISNVELVSHFRKALNDPLNQVNARLKFKDIVNTIANVQEEHGTKYILLKPEYFDSFYDDPEPENDELFNERLSKSVNNSSPIQNYQPYWRYRLSSNNKMVPPPPVLSARSVSCEENVLSKSLDDRPMRRPPNQGQYRSLSFEDSSSSKSVDNYSYAINEHNRVMNSVVKRHAGVYDEVARLLDSQDDNTISSESVAYPQHSTNYIPQSDSSDFSSGNSQHTLSNSSIGGLSVESDERKPRNRSEHEVILQHSVSKLVPSSDESCKNNDSFQSSPPFLSTDQIQPALEPADHQEECTPNGDADAYQLRSGSVKEIAQQIDKMASLDVPPRRSSPHFHRLKGRDHRNEKVSDDDSSVVSTLDSKLRRQWFVKAAQCDYHGLLALLKVEPRLAGIRDVASGFTALHWAAKHGNADVVKLIAGAYKVNPDVKSHGGYTCIHLATLYKHKGIVDLLLKTYGANPTIRDNNGKRADQYPPDYVCTVAGTTKQLVGARHIKSITIPLNNKVICVRPADKDPPSGTFLRIGSLNLKVSMTAPAFGSGRNRKVQRLRTWGSADCVTETRPTSIHERMSFRRKKKAKKKSVDLQEHISALTKQDSDSDSAYGFYS